MEEEVKEEYYGGEEGEKKSFLDLIIEYLRQKKGTEKAKLEEKV